MAREMQMLTESVRSGLTSVSAVVNCQVQFGTGSTPPLCEHKDRSSGLGIAIYSSHKQDALGDRSQKRRAVAIFPDLFIL